MTFVIKSLCTKSTSYLDMDLFHIHLLLLNFRHKLFHHVEVMVCYIILSLFGSQFHKFLNNFPMHSKVTSLHLWDNYEENSPFFRIYLVHMVLVHFTREEVKNFYYFKEYKKYWYLGSFLQVLVCVPGPHDTEHALQFGQYVPQKTNIWNILLIKTFKKSKSNYQIWNMQFQKKLKAKYIYTFYNIMISRW